MTSIDQARCDLEDALDQKSIPDIKFALKTYADLVQKVKLQIAARELMAQLGMGDELDENLANAVRELARDSGRNSSSEIIDTTTLLLKEFERYKGEVEMGKDIATEAKIHLQRVGQIISQ